MENLSMSQNTFCKIMKEYTRKPFFLGMDADDLEEVFNLVTDLLNAEADAIRAKEPYAVVTIREYEKSATVVNSARFDFAEAFEEVYRD